VWALLSDTHIHASLYEKNQNFHMAANLVTAVSEVVEEGAGAAIVNGDLARLLGNPEDYERFLELIEPLRRRGIPLHATLGNHDDRSNFRRALAPAVRFPGAAPETTRPSGDGGDPGVAARGEDPESLPDRLASAVEVDGVRWLLLDSLEKVNETRGLLGDTQLRWTLRQLERAPSTPTILFVHHNPETDNIGLKDTADLLALIRPRRQVKAVFFGHTHTWRRWEDEGIHMVNLPATGYAFKAGEPIGWVLAAPGPEGLEIELRSIGPPHADHGKKIALPWRK
jgi:3',5'-cyclic AMP phosphodiesterase CpdA